MTRMVYSSDCLRLRHLASGFAALRAQVRGMKRASSELQPNAAEVAVGAGYMTKRPWRSAGVTAPRETPGEFVKRVAQGADQQPLHVLPNINAMVQSAIRGCAQPGSRGKASVKRPRE